MTEADTATTPLAELEERYPPRDLPGGAEVTRIAPSPTGLPHVGTAMQAVLNGALAQGSDGVFIVRIEDTDRARLDERAVAEIEASLNWLGEVPDEAPWIGGSYGPYVQSQRLALYQAAAEWLIENGHAYPCFCSAERLERVRAAQREAGQPTRYDRHCRALSPNEVAERRAAGDPFVVRMLVRDGEEVAFEDPARGEIKFETDALDDSVIVKSDGYPTYHLAVVVDDHFMRVTTVVRGEEWISSTPKHLLLYRAFGWEPPRIAHTPVLRDEQRRKLSKRHGDTTLFGYYDAQGFLPEALVNFIARILWPHPEGLDVFPPEEFARSLDVAALNTAGPVVDVKLLLHINGERLGAMTPVQRFDRAAGWLARVRRLANPLEFAVFGRGQQTGTVPVSLGELERFEELLLRDPEYSMAVLALEPERYKKLSDVVLQGRMFFPETFEPPPAEELEAPLGRERAIELLSEYRGVFHEEDSLDDWEGWLRRFAADADVKPGAVFLTLRLAVTGARRSPPLYPVIRLIGSSELERRLRLALEALGE